MCDHQNMTPAEVTAWLDARDRKLRRRIRLKLVTNLALAGIVAILIVAAIAWATH